tara:strand:- start:159 stop:995 length:837 start_codon:yes stop_codon:yes gene_type:complete
MIENTFDLDYDYFELLILNQNSSDGTKFFLDSLNNSRIRIFHSKSNLGVAGGRNYLASKSNADYLIFLDDDSWFIESKALNNLKKNILEYNADICGFKIIGDDNKLRDWCYPLSPKNFNQKVHSSPYYVGCGHAIRNKMFKNLGGYNKNLFFWGEEIDFVLNCLCSLDLNIKYFPDITVLHVPSKQERFYWSGKRLYYKCRNRLFLFKYFPFSFKKMFLILAFIFRFIIMGIRHKNLRSVFTAFIDTRKLHTSKKLPKNKADEYLSHYIMGKLNLIFR